ncbi:MAG TPA: metallophosphoesterase [Candidatus Brocadiia bacterium]|nr:metallophosphoesterase [Candidatus Brocadiia bacterium]
MEERLKPEQANAEFRSPTSGLNKWLIRAGVACLCANIALLAAHSIWLVFFSGTPAAILPPANETLKVKAPFRFAIVGDNRGNMRVFEDVLAGIKAGKARLILHTGDLVKRCEERQYDWLLHELHEADPSAAFCPVPGNHDIDLTATNEEDMFKLYTRAFGPRRYWFSFADALFVAFDNSADVCNPDDLKWLDSTLEAKRKDYRLCFVFTHYPPLDPRPGKDRAVKKGGEELIRILKSRDVSCVFAGHIHGYLEGGIGGIPMFITGGAGAELEGGEGFGYHYLICDVDRDGKFTVTKHDIPDRINTDYVEYTVRVNYPDVLVLVIAAALTAAGLVILVAAGIRSRRIGLASDR